MLRGVLAPVAFVGFLAYAITWLVVAYQSDPTWWWFVPVYGTIKIFHESVWWGIFDVGILPAVFVAGALMGD